MLNFFRKQASLVKIVFGVVLFLTCVSMVVTLIPGLTGVEDTATSEVVAQVGKDRITTTDIQQQLEQMSRSNNIPQNMVWLYVPQILDGVVMDKILSQEAQRQGLSVSEQELKDRLKTVPDFFPNGRFVGEEAYENLITSRFGISVGEFEERYRDAILAEKLRDLITDPIVVSDDEVRKAFVHDNEKLVLKYVFIDPEKLKKDIAPTDAALQEYFQKNHDRYTMPEKRTVQLLVLNSATVRQGLTVSDADRRAYYQDHQDEYRIPERVQVQHILLKASPQDQAKMDQARAKAEDLLKQIKAGADFGDLAKKNSEDPGSAPQGGNLGWIVRGQTVPEFEKAAFGAAPGSVTGPIQTQYGIHLIKVITHEQAHIRTLAEVQGDIDKAILDQRVQASMDATSQQAMADWKKDPQSLDAVAGKYHTVTMKPPPFGHDEQIGGLPNGTPLVEEIFSMDKGTIGEPVEVPTGVAIPMLVDILPPRPAQFAEVKDRVRADAINDGAKDKATAEGLELAQAVEKQGDNRDLERAAKALSLTASATDPLTRSGSIPSVGSLSDLGPALDTLQPGQTAGPVSIGGGQIIYQLVSRQAPKDEVLAAQKESLRQRLFSEKQNVAFALYEQALKAKLTSSGDIKIYQDVLARMNAGQPH